MVFYHPPPDHKEIRLEIPFDPPVKGYEDATARLREWRYDALVHFKPVRRNLELDCSECMVVLTDV